MSDNENKKLSEDAGIAAEEHVPATSGEMERPADGIADEAINEAGCSDENEHEAEASASESNEETSADVEENVGPTQRLRKMEKRVKGKKKRAPGQPHSKIRSRRRISDSACTARLLQLSL